MSDFLIPSSERCVISLCLRNMDIFIEVQAKLSAENFLDKENRAIFIILSGLRASGILVFDLATVSGAAQELGMLNRSVSYDYLDALSSSSVDPANLEIHVNKVLDASLRSTLYKTLLTKAESIKAKAKDTKTDALSMIADVEQSILDISLDTLRIEDANSVEEGLRERLALYEADPGGIRGLPTGFTIFDNMVGGFCPGQLIILAARPKIGKSVILETWAFQHAFIERSPILYIDTEMSLEEHQNRMLSFVSKVPEKIIKKGTYVNNKEQHEAVYQALQLIEVAKEQNLYFHKCMPGVSIETIRSMARKYRAKYGIGSFFFDYIKLTEMEGGVREDQSLGFLAGQLKDLSTELKIPTIAAVQLGRKAEGKSHVDAGMIADSDRVLRYANLITAVCPKSAEELKENGIAFGTHNLQILNSRSGPEFYSGIDLMMKKPILTVYESEMQSSESILEGRRLLEQ